MSTFHAYNQWLVLGAVVLHVLAIAVYWKALRTNLAKTMITGTMDAGADSVAPRARSSWLALLLLLGSAAAVYALVIAWPAAK